MKKHLFAAVLLILAGCDYEVPLSQTAAVPADPVLAGIWTGLSGEGKTVSMKIETAGTGYRVVYAEGSDSLIFQGFGVHADGLSLIQLELQNANEQNRYLFAKYELTPDGLSVQRLNPEVVSAKCQSPDELRNDIAVHRKNPRLFYEPQKFSKSVQP